MDSDKNYPLCLEGALQHISGVKTLIKHILITTMMLMAVLVSAEENIQPQIGIDDSFLGQTVSLDLAFMDEEGKPTTILH